jgi:hypothetical protein
LDKGDRSENVYLLGPLEPKQVRKASGRTSRLKDMKAEKSLRSLDVACAGYVFLNRILSRLRGQIAEVPKNDLRFAHFFRMGREVN